MNVVNLAMSRDEAQMILELLSRARERGGQWGDKFLEEIGWGAPEVEKLRALSAKVGLQLAAEVEDGQARDK